MKKWIVLAVVLVIGAALGWQVYQRLQEQRQVRGRPPAPVATVEAARAVQGRIEKAISLTGSLVGVFEVQVAPKIQGRLVEVKADMGDPVQKGQLIARLDDEEARHLVQEEEARLAMTRANLEENNDKKALAKLKLDRGEQLDKQHLVSEADLDALRSEYKALLSRERMLEAQVKQAAAALEAARVRLSYTKILSPITGFVGKEWLDTGALVSSNTTIFSLVDLSSVKTVVNVVEADYPLVKVGHPASLRVDAYPSRVFEGRVARIAPVLDVNTRTAEVIIEVPNPDYLLKPGMFARVRLVLGAVEDAVLVPSRALVKRNGSTGVFVLDKERTSAKFQTVTVKAEEGERVWLPELAPGDEIVVVGQHLLEENSPVRVINGSAGSPGKPDAQPRGSAAKPGAPGGKSGPQGNARQAAGESSRSESRQ